MSRGYPQKMDQWFDTTGPTFDLLGSKELDFNQLADVGKFEITYRLDEFQNGGFLQGKWVIFQVGPLEPEGTFDGHLHLGEVLVFGSKYFHNPNHNGVVAKVLW